MSDVTLILNAIEQGDATATARLLPLVYQELRQVARRQMEQERGGHTLQATALVHEAYVRLVGGAAVGWDSRGRFFAAAAEAMRRILIEHARRRKAMRHGGEQVHVPIVDDEIPAIAVGCRTPDELLDLNDALDRLAREDAAKADLVKLTYFAGLSLEEAAQALGISRATAYRHWTFARAWLREAMDANGAASKVEADRDRGA
jgi:RNA polymerase sigma factor (TIGR02999 family)